MTELYFLLFLEVSLGLLLLIPGFNFLYHPLIFSVLLTIFSIFLSIKINLFNSNYWYSYMLFLVMVGGVMILMLYFTSLSNNEKIYVLSSVKIYILKFIFMWLFFYLIFKIINMEFIWMEYFNFYNWVKDESKEYMNLYMNFSLDMIIFMIIYLFFTMMICVLICLKNSSPMRCFF